MKENESLQQVATQDGLQHYPQQGPWGRKSGSAVGTRDGYVTAIGFSRDRQGANVVILLRFKKLEQPDLVNSAVKSAAIKKGKLSAVGNNFLRWDWKYSFTKPKAEEVAKLAEDLRAAIKPVTMGFDGPSAQCPSTSPSPLPFITRLPSFISA